MEKTNITEAIVSRFADLMIDRMEAMKNGKWDKPWIDVVASGLPCNASGRNYSSSNAFFLMLFSAENNYRVPVFLTAKQANDLGAHILKGEKSFPVYFWNILYKDKEGKTVPEHEVAKMSNEERSQLKSLPMFKYYNVFNIDQTNLREANSKKYDKIVARFNPKELKDDAGMYANPAIDRMIEKQEWVCPIYPKESNRAYYRSSTDTITIPLKAQYNKGGSQEEIYTGGMEYYSTLLHEMTHSTLKEGRLNRTAGKTFGDEAYAREELVAEMTSALLCSGMGFKSSVIDNSAMYLDNWIKALKEEPKFLLSVMSDVNKAGNMIVNEIDKQNVALGLTPLKSNFIEGHEEERKMKVSLFQNEKGEMMISAYNGKEYLGSKPVAADDYRLYVTLDEKEKEKFGNQLAGKFFATELKNETGRKASNKLSA